MTKKRQQKRKTVDESESTPQETSQKALKKQKTVVAPTASTRRSERISRQESDLSLSGATKKSLRISSGSDSEPRSDYEIKDLPPSASKYSEEDMRALNVTFVPASNQNEVIPNIQVANTPEEYFLPNLTSDMLRRPNFNVDDVQASGHVKTFLNNLHRVVKNAGVDIGTAESKTDTLINHLLLRVIDFGDWPLSVRVKESYNLSISDKQVSAKPEYVVDNREIAMIIIEDKHLKNVTAPEFGEAQMMIEILACGNENIRTARAITDQTIFVVRVVSSYVTFYKSEISTKYWKELKRGLPRREEVKVLRWPAGNDPLTGLDLAEPVGRRAVLTALVKIRQSILQSSNTTTASGSSTIIASAEQSITTESAEQSITTASQDQAEPISKSEGKKAVK